MPRIFTGLQIPDSLKQRLMLIKSELGNATWISPENYHITLRFVGDVENRIADDFATELDKIMCNSFQIRISGLGSFGGNKPRYVWAAVEADENLSTLRFNHERAARLVGLPPESRNYTPHITLARLRNAREAEVARYLENFGDFKSDWFEVNSFALFSSRDHKGGGQYIVEETYSLEE